VNLREKTMKQAIFYTALALFFTMSITEFGYAGDRKSGSGHKAHSTKPNLDAQSESLGNLGSDGQIELQGINGRRNQSENTAAKAHRNQTKSTESLIKKF